MKKTIALIAFISISNLATAADHSLLQHRFTDYGRVLDVEPVFKRVKYQKPQKECWIEQEEHVVTYEGSNQSFRQPASNASSHRGGDAIIGGIIGGVIGNQIGRHGGRGARNGATIAGAIIGSALANEASGSVSRSSNSTDNFRHRRHRRVERPVIQNTRQPSRTVTTRPVERCRETIQTSYERRIRAYDVTYQYRGQTFTTRMKRDPGDRIELQINVAPARQ